VLTVTQIHLPHLRKQQQPSDNQQRPHGALTGLCRGTYQCGTVPPHAWGKPHTHAQSKRLDV